MSKKRLVWQIFTSYLVIILISLILVTWYATQSLKDFYKEQTILDLKAKASLVENQLLSYFSQPDTKNIDKICRQNGIKGSLRITVILPSGQVIGDSEEAPGLMNNHRNRPEVISALEGKTGSSTRFSNTLKKNMVYVAIPLVVNSQIQGVVRTATPLLFLENSLKELYFKIILAGIIIASISALFSYKVSRGISRPLELRNKEQQVVLSSMKEGIIAIDSQEKIINMNKSAAQMFHLDLNTVYGKNIKEFIDNKDFNHFIEEALINNKTMEDNIVLKNANEQFIQIYSSPIYNEENIRTGTLIVLNDMTRIKKLENIRRDFVANVSHELRTPVTSIKGFVETLLDGELNDPEEIESFLNIIRKHANRLNAIIEDLLSISRLEQGAEKITIAMEKTNLKNILKSAVQLSEAKAGLKNINIKLDCDEKIVVNANPSLLEQAIINLVDNAVNYSNEGSFIDIEGRHTGREIIIKVQDQGCGIPKEHLQRIFERFYRVDKARSRKAGGTGLGLAIVKHISQVHGGYVRVESKLGEGSVFYIHLPA